MSKPLTILLIDNSPVTSVKIVETLQNTKEVDNVFYARDLKKGCAMFAASTIDVLILATYIVNDELINLSNLCKLYQCEIILLSQYSDAGYSSWCRQIGIAHLLDKTYEVDKVANILKQFSYN